MKNKGVYFVIISTLGTLAAFQNFPLLLTLFSLLLLFLHKKKKLTLLYVFVSIHIFLLLYARTEIEMANNYSKLIGTEKFFILFINDISKIDGDLLTIPVIDKKTSEKLIYKYKIKSENEKNWIRENITPGLSCKVIGKLEEPRPSTNENAFDYKKYLKRKHFYWILRSKTLNPNNCQSTPTFISTIKKLRFNGIRYLENHFPKETVPLAAALLFGTSDYISSETIDHYRELGIIHLLAISGLHIAIIVAIVYYLFLRIGLTREITINLLLFCLPIYCILTGATPSVNRSIIMTILLLIGKQWGSDRYSISTIDLISITFILYIFFSPNIIFDIGFLLSFTVTFTLILSSSFILDKYKNPIFLLFSISYLSMLSSAPILLYFFYEFSIISILANLVYIPVFNLILLPLLIGVFVTHFILGDLIGPLVQLLNQIIIIVNTITVWFSNFPLNKLTIGRPSTLIIIVYIAGFFTFLIFWEKDFFRFGRKFFFFLSPFVLFFGQFMFENHFNKGEITFIDVGQGDSILIRLPLGQGTYLIDTGGVLLFEKESWQVRDRNFEVGEDTIVPLLKSKGITTIDKLIITHGDMDHAGGAVSIMDRLKIRELVIPEQTIMNDQINKLIKKAREEKVPVKFVNQSHSWTVGETHFDILSPEKNHSLSSNNGSLVLYTKIGGLRWLFTGDLEVEGEQMLVNKYQYLNVDVLKVGHHGSKSSTSELFLDQLRPKIAVISVGKNNRFGHPNKEILQRLNKRNITILRTDLSGAVTYTYSKESGTFLLHNP